MLLTLDCTDVTRAIEDVESKCIDVVEEVNVGVEGSIDNILVTADILETVFSKDGDRLVLLGLQQLAVVLVKALNSQVLPEFTVIGLVCC